MCTGKCSLFIAISLYPLVLLSILCNILLFFPDWSTKSVKEGHITDEVKYMGGFIGGGVLVLIPALYIHLTGEQGCCANRLGMFFSVIFAAVGAAGAVYSFIVALLGLYNGPLCRTSSYKWERPFMDKKAKERGPVQHGSVHHPDGGQRSAGSPLCQPGDQRLRRVHLWNLQRQGGTLSLSA
ncbi:transmembrane 4 L6 family member 4-like isoform X3 [Gambusia affinis]|uniref:transmembrane 4 L6 family member 4-like isoform X3 n=1 Tax=Gambusia affinis TaxID=33528 RepID=UPI001CDBF412|nr:transmembrane 4 L6 family member 4-like isoform X3 [Gambusia affinis]